MSVISREAYLRDSDLTLYVGDALDVLRELPDESVDCCVTSPPYWGLRDYGTGEWEGGDESCDHAAEFREYLDVGDRNEQGNAFRNSKRYVTKGDAKAPPDVCGRCGARRIDRQIGLEATPDLFVAAMVAVFREVRRVLAPHGTCWVNLGDSYASDPKKGGSGTPNGRNNRGEDYARGKRIPRGEGRWGGGNGHAPALKPKDLVGIPWRVAFALQQDGWWLRSDIIWSKPNPMPESVTDRPTKAHEYVFLLTKQPRYWFDAEAVRERYTDPREGGEGFRWNSERYTNQTAAQSNHTPTGRGPDGRKVTTVVGKDGSEQHRNGERWPNPAGRNVRSVWEIATQPYPEAHFATFPEELPRRAIAAGCPLQVCRVCGKPRERIVENKRRYIVSEGGSHADGTYRVKYSDEPVDLNFNDRRGEGDGFSMNKQRWHNDPQTLGWSDCGHQSYRPGVVLDPFAGAGTTLLVARKLGRHSIGIELNPEYAELIARRTRQLSLLAETV